MDDEVGPQRQVQLPHVGRDKLKIARREQPGPGGAPDADDVVAGGGEHTREVLADVPGGAGDYDAHHRPRRAAAPSSGHAASRPEMAASGSGHVIASAGSSQRTPLAASGS